MLINSRKTQEKLENCSNRVQGLSSSIPTHLPVSNLTIPTNLTVPSPYSSSFPLIVTRCPTLVVDILRLKFSTNQLSTDRTANNCTNGRSDARKRVQSTQVCDSYCYAKVCFDAPNSSSHFFGCLLGFMTPKKKSQKPKSLVGFEKCP